MFKNKFVFLILLLFIWNFKVNATVLNVEELDNYFVVHNDSVTKMKKFTDNTTKKVLFSFNIYDDIIDTELDSEVFNRNIFQDIDSSLLDDIQDAIYLGYGYKGKNTTEWYVFTQYMLWNMLGYNVEILDCNGDDILTIFKEEYMLYLKEIERYKIYPSFMDAMIDVNFGESLTIIDTNNVLNEYKLEFPTSVNVSYKNNSIKLHTSIPAEGYVIGHRIDSGEKNNLVYVNKNNKFITNSASSNRVFRTGLNVHGTKIKIINIDEENKAIANNYFELYNSTNKNITTLKTDHNGEGITVYLPYDNYYLKERYINNDYTLINKRIDIEINDYGITEVLLKYKFKTANIKVNINYKNSEGKNITAKYKYVFQIFNGDNLIIEKETNNGQLLLELPIGEYIIKQVNSNYNLPLIEERIKVTNFDDIIINKEFVIEDIKDDTVEEKLKNNNIDNLNEFSDESENVINNDFLEDNNKYGNEYKEVEFVVPSTGIELTIYIIIISISLFLFGFKLYDN